MDQLRQDYERRMQALEDRLKRFETPIVATGTNVTRDARPSRRRQRRRAGPTRPRPGRRLSSAAREFAQAAVPGERRKAGPRPCARHQRLPPATASSRCCRISWTSPATSAPATGATTRAARRSAFQAPGALAKYRLGNEAENYGELTFGKNWYVPGMFQLGPASSGPTARPPARSLACRCGLSFYNPYSALQFRRGHGFRGCPRPGRPSATWSASQPSMKFWAGSRYYRRHDIHINDFFFYNMSGAGGGVEDIPTALRQDGLGLDRRRLQSDLYSDIPSPRRPTTGPASARATGISASMTCRCRWAKASSASFMPAPTAAWTQTATRCRARMASAFTFLHPAEPVLDQRRRLQQVLAAVRHRAGQDLHLRLRDVHAYQWRSYIRPDANDSWRFRATEHFIAAT